LFPGNFRNFPTWKPNGKNILSKQKTIPENEYGNLTISKDLRIKSCSKSPAFLGVQNVHIFQGVNFSAQLFFSWICLFGLGNSTTFFFMRDCSHGPGLPPRVPIFTNVREKILLKSITLKETTPRNHSTNSNMPLVKRGKKTFRIARKKPFKLWKC